ncbi:MAG TPA: amidohydrolase family protein [Vicinamibacterales bacterium]|nr:amidohydrolase family protein [Vicinamibacterales bacterium]
MASRPRFGADSVAALLSAAFSLFAQAPIPPGAARAFTGATVIDGTGAQPIRDAVIVVQGGRVIAVGPAGTTVVPPAAERIDLPGRTIIPGLINAHGHVGSTAGLRSGEAVNTEDNVRRQLALTARYGVTTIVSLGDDREAGFRMRDTNDRTGLDRSRLYVAGPVVNARTPAEARAAVETAAGLKPDWIKIRVDDNLGTTEKMQPEVYRAVIEQAHARGLRVAAHLFYLEDAKGLLRAGVDLLAHSVRDVPVDRELIELMKARGVCLCPTLMREVSTFVYESRPAFFDDPFFRREVEPGLLAALEDPARQAGVAASRSAQAYKKALEVARANVKSLHAAGIGIASGTDTGPPARFQGYFEHLELEELVKSGLGPSDALFVSTGGAARCLGLSDHLGTLQPGRWADLIVLSRSPLDDIRNTRTIESVWIAGNRVPGAQTGDQEIRRR